FRRRDWSSTGPQSGAQVRQGAASSEEAEKVVRSNLMSNVLFQTIDQISREKGIDPQIVIHAIEDAIVVASRKHFKSNEELRGRINPENGDIDVYAIRKVVPEVTNPVSEISLEEAREHKDDAQMDEGIEC